MLAFHDKGHDMWEIEFEQRNGKLYLLAFEPVIAPPELGGPADGAGTTPEAAEAASGSAVSPDSPEKGSAPDFSLDELLKLADRVRHIEEFLTRNMEFEA